MSGIFYQEINFNFALPTSCIFRLRGALISITNHQIRETRWLAKPYVWFNLRKVLFRSLEKCCVGVESKVHIIRNRKHIFMITQENDGILLQVARKEEESLEATVAILYKEDPAHSSARDLTFASRLCAIWIPLRSVACRQR